MVPLRAFDWLITAVCAIFLAFACGLSLGSSGGGRFETIYLVNHSTALSNVTIERDIPAWEKAANEDFAPVWRTPQIRLELVNAVPKGGIEALFVNTGPVVGALAYHTVRAGVPEIVVYTVPSHGGESRVFTHELFETLADPTTSQFNEGRPFHYITVVGAYPYSIEPMPKNAVFLQEVCDPVEAFAYRLDGVEISDFITPRWFNDAGSGRFDHMGKVAGPFTIAVGGYALYAINGRLWSIVNLFAR